MNPKLNFALALAAGIVGGVLSHYLAPIVVLAQSQNAPPKEIRAERFILVDAKGVPRGVFAIETSGMPTIEAMTDDGHVYNAHPATESTSPEGNTVTDSAVTGWP